MGGLNFFLLTNRLETLSARLCDCVENVLSELALPSYVEHPTIVSTTMAEIQANVFLKPSQAICVTHKDKAIQKGTF